MIKYSFFLIIFLISSKSISQNLEEIEGLFFEDICNCFSNDEKQTISVSEPNMKLLEVCYVSTFTKNEKKFMEHIAKEIDTTAIPSG